MVELVVVIAIIGILAGIAVPRFLDATASARGAKIVADMRTIQSAEMIYYAKNAKYPTAQNDFADLVQGNWPGVPTGKFIIAQVLKKGGGTTEGVAGDGAAYTYTAGADGASGTITLTGATNLTGVSGSSYTLTVLLGGDQQVTTPNARGSRLVADLRTIESAESMYYAEKGQFATMEELVDNGYLAVEPIPPIGAFKVAETNQAGEIKDTVISYTVTPSNDTTPKTVTINAGTNIDLKTLMTRKNN